jgi:hypothetical protein
MTGERDQAVQKPDTSTIFGWLLTARRSLLLVTFGNLPS